MFSSKIFDVLVFTFRFMTYLEKILMCGMRKESRFIVFPYGYPVASATFIQNTLLPSLNCTGRVNWSYMGRSNSRLYILFISISRKLTSWSIESSKEHGICLPLYRSVLIFFPIINLLLSSHPFLFFSLKLLLIWCWISWIDFLHYHLFSSIFLQYVSFLFIWGWEWVGIFPWLYLLLFCLCKRYQKVSFVFF